MKKSYKTLKIGKKYIGPEHPVYIVFEAGPTHDGLETAKKLVDVAVDAGADAIKFQILNAEQMVSSRNVIFTYNRLIDQETGETEEVSEPLLDILKRRELTWEEWNKLITHCRKKDIVFFSTVTNEEELHFLAENRVETVKICSGDVNFHFFLKQTANYDWIIQIDTGLSSIGEIETAVNILENCSCNKIIIHHCPSGYPARLEGINLGVIQTLLQMFPYPIGFSDHSIGHDMDIAAVALGANMIEKTITLNRTIRSPEHIMSLEPYDAREFVQTIRNLEVSLGDYRRVISEEEKKQRNAIRRSLFAARDIKKGEVVNQEMLKYARPGDGIPADMDVSILGRRLKRNISALQKLSFEDFD